MVSTASPLSKKKSRGKALDFDDDRLLELAQVTAQDIEEAKAFWRAKAPPEFRDLLDAEAKPNVLT
jgi:hypothetical protein